MRARSPAQPHPPQAREPTATKPSAPANCIEQGNIAPALVRLVGNVRAWRVAEANTIIAAARGERILPKPRQLVSETNFSVIAWAARTAQQMGVCEQTSEGRWEYRRPSAR